MSRPDQLRARIDRTLASLTALSLPPGVRLPTGPNPQLLAALDLVLPHLPAERAEALTATYAEQQPLACVHDLVDDPEILALVQRPAAELPRLRRGLDRLLQPRSSTWHPWSAPDADALLTERPTPLALHQLTAHAPGSPMRGLAPFQRAVLRQRLAAGTPPAVLLDRQLNAHLLHELCRGPARGWAGGWPAFTLLEAATTHVQRRCAPEQVFPTTLGEAPGGTRHFAMLGAYLALWRSEARTWQLATAARTPQDGLGERATAPLVLADLQAWLARGGHHLGPAWSDPFAWLKLLAQATHGGPLDALLRKVPRAGPATVELATELPDLLTAAAGLHWHELPVWREPPPPESLPDLLGAAVSAMLCEDVTGPTLEAAPSDPPRGELLLHTDTCTLSAPPAPTASTPSPPAGCSRRAGSRACTGAACAPSPCAASTTANAAPCSTACSTSVSPAARSPTSCTSICALATPPSSPRPTSSSATPARCSRSAATSPTPGASASTPAPSPSPRPRSA